ncbi:MAG TPA: glycosyltransferase [candidate division Zixibacteria bacterium]|nr:glycosyltransferase [candidate division Zixibacteria bacterium]MDD4918170.1 glycosyltransferase [candidate division Zixibacteria bacterium]MDM7972778.1 glycosyltransferase [candidate division Zixibacteria bacterium]HOD67198.1 glycosyltransferase [candidate division Zixibacteria bacterium]HPM37312.1 glycosyltransferase [candidate division Zixibacteria bacterium]
MNWTIRFRLALWDFLRFHPACRFAASAAIRLYLRLPALRRDESLLRAARLNVRAARICPHPGLLRRLERSLDASVGRLLRTNFDWDALSHESRPDQVAKGIILKHPVSPREKGVLFISFEGQWLRLFRHADIDRLARDYHLVIAPSWSPPHSLAFSVAARRWPGRFFTLISNLNEIPVFARIAPNSEVVPLFGSSWVHPQIFDVSAPVAKEYDIVILANFAAYKRHFLLFRALRDMRPDTRVLLLGKSMDGRTPETIMNEARAYGVADRITIKPGLPDGEMIRAFRSARVALMLSGNEGSCVAVVESMFADIPIGVFEDAVIGSLAYVNEHTGRRLRRRRLGRQLEEFIADSGRYSPRRWVMENGISCFGSTAVLNDALRARVLEWGEEWTTDLAPHHWRPNPTYVYDEDLERHRSAYARFERDYRCSLLLRATDGSPLTSALSARPSSPTALPR